MNTADNRRFYWWAHEDLNLGPADYEFIEGTEKIRGELYQQNISGEFYTRLTEDQYKQHLSGKNGQDGF